MVNAKERFYQALKNETPLKIAGTINAYCALLAEQAGFQAIYLSGAGVANASFGIPDLGLTCLNDVCEDIRRITGATELPLLVDAATGFGSALNIARTVKEMSRSGAAGIHLEDQVRAKRCGHRPDKELVTCEEMCDRIKAACDSRELHDIFIMARTDAHAVEGRQAALDRAQAYIDCGADMIFAEALHSLEDYQLFCKKLKVPVLANITEFGKTPYFTCDELHQAGVGMVLYPLSAFRAMSKAALNVYNDIRQNGTQKGSIEKMQSREELYGILDYYSQEEKSREP